MKMTAPLYQPLPASATTEEWRVLVNLVEQHLQQDDESNEAFWEEANHQPRPLKPNDDNYAAFVGPQWKVSTMDNPATYGELPPQLATILQRMQQEPTPHYDCCATCTSRQDAAQLLQCSRCKMVKYCSRNCQKQHWKPCHKASCEPARPCSLIAALKTNEGFWIANTECRALARLLGQTLTKLNKEDDETLMIRRFALYFERAANLDGCFVL